MTRATPQPTAGTPIERARTRLRRSVHFVPGGNERMRSKAGGLAADALVLDLEDAVAPDERAKADARHAVAAWLIETPATGHERIVRINAADTAWFAADLAAIVPARPDALMIPKVESAAALRELDRRLATLEARAGLPIPSLALVVIATETPRAVLDVAELARAPRVAALTWGAEDLSAALGARRTRDDAGAYLPVFEHARVQTLLAARAAGVQAIDGVFTGLDDPEGLAHECAAAADSGFDGKLTIHPNQLAAVNGAFAPGADEVADANALLAAYEEHAKSGSGALRFRGAMIDAPHVARARSVLERAALVRAAEEASA